MFTRNRVQGAWVRLQTVLPPVITVVLFWLIFRRFPLSRFQESLMGAEYTLFFSALVPFSVLYFALDTLVLQWVMGWFHGWVQFSEFLPVRAVDYLVSLLNGKLSQGAMVAYLSRKLKAPLLSVISSMIFLDSLQKTHLVLWATIGMGWMSWMVPRALLGVPLVVAAAWVIFLLYAKGRLRVVSSRLRAPEWTLLRSFKQASFKCFAVVLMLKAPLLIASAYAHSLALRAFDIELPFTSLLATLPIIFLVGALPVAVARLGTSQAAWLYFYSAQFPESDIVAYSLAAHLTFLLSNALLGVIFLPRAYRDLFGGWGTRAVVEEADTLTG